MTDEVYEKVNRLNRGVTDQDEAGSTPSTGSGTAGFKTVHLSLSVRGALRNRDYDWFIKEDGTPATKDEAFEFLCDKLADGWEVLPIGDCDTFDKKTGCPGHRAESPNCDYTTGK